MKSLNLQKLFVLILACFIMANFGYAQQKQKTKSEKSPKKVVIIKKSIDADGNVKTEKTIREGNDIHDIEFDDKDGRVIIEEIEGMDGKEIKVEVDYDDFDIDAKKNINVNIEKIDGEKHIKVRVHPEGGEERIIEWEGAGDLPEDVRKELEEKGVFLQELDGEGKSGTFFIHSDGEHNNFQFKTSTQQSGAFLGVMSAHEAKVTIVMDEDGNETKTESSSPKNDGISIGEVIEGSAAAEAGLLAGDILRTIDGNALSDFNDLVDFMQDTEVGQKISIGYERDGQMQQTKATLQERKGEMSNVIIERIMEDEDLDSDEKGNTFFFYSDDANGTKIHKRHSIIVITKSNKEHTEDEIAEMPFNMLPDTELQRTLQLRELSIAPNPTEGNLRLRFAGEAFPTTIKVSDLNGKQMFREHLNSFDGQYDQNIDLSDLPAGVFLLTIEQNDKVHTEQIIVK